MYPEVSRDQYGPEKLFVVDTVMDGHERRRREVSRRNYTSKAAVPKQI